MLDRRRMANNTFSKTSAAPDMAALYRRWADATTPPSTTSPPALGIFIRSCAEFLTAQGFSRRHIPSAGFSPHAKNLHSPAIFAASETAPTPKS